ncbi:Osmotin, thaumatin-like protein [Meredithblackwellia eburnea MCA 4105]
MVAGSIAFQLLALATVALAREFTIKNNCGYTIWPAYLTQEGAAPTYPTGWEAAPGSSVSMTVPEGWIGRFWARTGCDFSTGTGSCLTGGVDCSAPLALIFSLLGGSFACLPGATPASLAEFTLEHYNGLDWYDLSAVDGTNVPIAVTPSVASCPAISCAKNVNPSCPSELRLAMSQDAKLLALRTSALETSRSSTAAWRDQYDSVAACPESAVPYASFFKQACPDQYAWAHDDVTATFTCSQASYTVTFFCVNHLQIIGNHQIWLCSRSLDGAAVVLTPQLSGLSEPPAGSAANGVRCKSKLVFEISDLDTQIFTTSSLELNLT